LSSHDDLSELQANWDRLGREDPLWAILSEPGKRGEKWDVDAFFATGRDEVDALMREVDARAPALARGKALDFGCGAGRLTRALAQRFDEVLGVDIAPSMIQLATTLNRDIPNCAFRANMESDLAFIPDASVDFVYSSVTLQHVPPHATRAYLREFVRILAPGGVAVFNLPAGNDWSLKGIAHRVLPLGAVNWIRRRRHRCASVIELHPIPRPQVVDVLRQAGGRIIDITPDARTGLGWTGYLYYVGRT